MSQRRRRTRQRGFALLSVLIISAILVLSAFMFSAQLTAESHITKTDSMFKSALSEAEAGLSTVLAMVRTGKSPDAQDWATHFGIPTEIPAISGKSESGGVRGAYVVTSTLTSRVRKRTEPIFNTEVPPVQIGTREYWTSNLDLVATAGVYPPAVVSMLNDSLLADGYTAKRSIWTRAQVSWTMTTGPGDPSFTKFSVNYGVFTGGGLSIKGDSSEWHGDVYAAGDAYIQKNSSVREGEVYASGQITGNPPGTPHPNVQPPIPFPEIDTGFLHSMAHAYISGARPYDGTEPGYTNTAAILEDANPMDSKYVAIQKLISNPADMSAYIDPTAVYYVDGSMTLNGGDLFGTVVVNGDITIHGGITVGSGGTLPTIIATGNVIKENGHSVINGIVYAGGTFTGNGTARINGALIARGAVDMKGTLDVYYDKGLGTIVIGGTPGGNTELYGLQDIVLPSSGDRIWQEVIPN